MQPLLLSVTLVLTFCGFGSWKILRHQRHAIEIQMRLDHDSGGAALKFCDLQNQLARENLKIEALRAAVLAALALQNPAAAETARAALRALALVQDQRVQWALLEWSALLARGISVSTGEIGHTEWTALWSRLPEDVIGPQVLDWNGGDRIFFSSREQQHGSRSVAYQTAAADWNAVFL